MGLLLLVRRRNPQRNRNSLIDAAILTLGLSLLSWVLQIAPYLHDPTLGVLPKLVSVAYPVGDIIMLAAAVRLILDHGGVAVERAAVERICGKDEGADEDQRSEDADLR